MTRVKRVGKKMKELSPRQRRRIEDTIRGNPERLLKSKTLEALLDDDRIFGENLLKFS
jgi:hypothetical protein